MNVVIGDPLYRPYTRWTSLEPDTREPNIWQRYRQIVLAAGGDPLAAADALRKLAAETRNSMPIEALAQAQAAAGDIDTALGTLAEAAKLEKKPKIRFRLALERIEFLRRAGRASDALRAVSDALGEFPGDGEQLTLGQLALILKPNPSPGP
jgi:tetratricopeptide (TPR) repeat protein